MTSECPELERFVRGEIDAAAFPHREHVRLAFEMLRRHDFAESVWLYSRALRTLTTRAGRPQAFHQTMTVALLALIAERMAGGGHADFVLFEHAYPDLFEKQVLAPWYHPEQLASDVARRIFVLPPRTP